MNNFELYLTTCQKFKNDFIPQLPDIIYILLIDDKEKLIKLLQIKIDKQKLINKIINSKVTKRTQIINLILEFLKEEHIEL